MEPLIQNLSKTNNDYVEPLFQNIHRLIKKDCKI